MCLACQATTDIWHQWPTDQQSDGQTDRPYHREVKIHIKAENKQVPVETMMRPGRRLMVGKEEEKEEEVVVVVCCGGGQHWWSPWGLWMCYLLIFSEIHWWKKVVTDGPTDRRTEVPIDGPYRDAWTHLKRKAWLQKCCVCQRWHR